MSADERKNPDDGLEYEGQALILHGRIKNLESDEAERKKEEKKYRDDQLAINKGQLNTNRKIASFTLLLVICTALTGGIAIWQARIAQTAATAARDAARAASDNANTAAYALLQNEWSSSFILMQMESQSAAQERSANATERSVQASRENTQKSLDASIAALQLTERPWVYISHSVLSSDPANGGSFTIISYVSNTGKTPAFDIASAQQPGTWYMDQAPPATDWNGPAVNVKPQHGGLLPPSISQYVIETEPKTLLGGELAAYKAGSFVIVLKSKIEYTDSFKNTTYWTTVCMYHANGKPLSEFGYCKNGNDVGENKRAQK